MNVKKIILALCSAVLLLNTAFGQDVHMLLNGKRWKDQTIKKGDKITVQLQTDQKATLKLSVQHRSVIGQMDADYARSINKTVSYTSEWGVSPTIDINVDDFINGHTSRLIIRLLDARWESGEEVSGVNYRKTYSFYADGYSEGTMELP